eukprot:6207105-Pyramimonas_sp.AAC.1
MARTHATLGGRGRTFSITPVGPYSARRGALDPIQVRVASREGAPRGSPGAVHLLILSTRSAGGRAGRSASCRRWSLPPSTQPGPGFLFT